LSLDELFRTGLIVLAVAVFLCNRAVRRMERRLARAEKNKRGEK
jgi:ABC-type nitrate/sulfonate/bicarbonate transport system permease component